MDENPSPAVGYIHYSDGHAEFTFNSTETRASGTEMKSRDEADEVLGIEHLRFSFHQIIKELLTCQIPRGHRLRPPGTFPPGLQSIPTHWLEWLWVWCWCEHSYISPPWCLLSPNRSFASSLAIFHRAARLPSLKQIKCCIPSQLESLPAFLFHI